ncbi:MAG: hypothetical protein F4Y35_03755 [Chloroflexi bacterium]|nr:hypothetical protein [Chloroflexota bacterium]
MASNYVLPIEPVIFPPCVKQRASIGDANPVFGALEQSGCYASDLQAVELWMTGAMTMLDDG